MSGLRARDRIMAILDRQGYVEVSIRDPLAWRTRELLSYMKAEGIVKLATPVTGSHYVYSRVDSRGEKT